ncbi:hypothetical protein SAMN05421595_2499 [Austwickia chelonae]|uniref:Uncharacterized protein n=1 Tax=Austwickia chelonae NBRC 105200 TaxID=1184607 RepID=K6VR18_9MICO|nr:ABC transporter permease [Austwickia chelonae]GAB79194.1 hypothetical protein AUCHE_21_00190 [Austwickia chelonae NBRC 105200]SEW37110.1 hypothetical protein SAMN05421595_2499 [Austwickia chelonae]
MTSVDPHSPTVRLPRPRRHPRLTAASRAELLRWRRSPAQRTTAVAASYGAAVCLLHAASTMDGTWRVLNNWNNIWAVLIGPLYALLLGATITRAETATRSGGTLWRSSSPTAARAARAVFLLLHLTVANLAAITIPLIYGLLVGFPGPAPVPETLLLSAVSTLSQSAPAALGTVLAHTPFPGLSLTAAAGFIISWIFVGTVETDDWAAWPANWFIRGTLPLTGTHANGIGLETGSHLWHITPWTPATASFALAVLVFLCMPVHPRRPASVGLRRHSVCPGASSAPEAEYLGLPQRFPVVAALALVLARTSTPWIAPGLFAVGLLFLRWQPVSNVTELVVVLFLPVAATVLPLKVWAVLSPGRRALRTRATGNRRMTVSMLVMTLFSLFVLYAAALSFLVVHGLSGDIAWRLWTAGMLTVSVLVPATFLSAATLGVAVTGAFNIAGVVLGLLVGASSLQSVLWPFLPWSWGVLSWFQLRHVLLGVLVAALAAGLVRALCVIRLGHRGGC